MKVAIPVTSSLVVSSGTVTLGSAAAYGPGTCLQVYVWREASPQKAEKPQVKHQQAAHRQGGQNLRGKALVIRPVRPRYSPRHRSRWLKASTITMRLPASTSPARSRHSWVSLRSASSVEPSAIAVS